MVAEKTAKNFRGPLFATPCMSAVVKQVDNSAGN